MFVWNMFTAVLLYRMLDALRGRKPIRCAKAKPHRQLMLP